MIDLIDSLLIEYSLITAFAVVGLTIWFSYFISSRLTRGRLHGSAIAIFIGLLLAYFGGLWTGGKKGIADFPELAGIGLMGGGMLRDFAIVATAMGVRVEEFRRTGIIGVLSPIISIGVSFTVGAGMAHAFGYHDAVSMTTIGAGATSFIVGPITGSAIGASSEVIALSIAAGLTKSVLVMILTPLLAKSIGLDNPRTALIYGGLMGTTSGVAAGLAATDPKLVPYGTMTAVFHSGLGCLMGPSLMFFLIRSVGN